MSMDTSPLPELVACAPVKHYRLTLLPRPDLDPRAAGTTSEGYRRSALAGDAAVAVLACLLAEAALFGAQVPPAYWLITMSLPTVWICVLAARRGYAAEVLGAGRLERQTIVVAGAALVVLAATSSYLVGAGLLRSYVLACAVGAVLGSLAVRGGLLRRLHRARRAGRGLRRVLVVGHADLAAAAIEALDAAPQHGYVAVAACLPVDGSRVSPPHGIPLAADVAEVLTAVDDLDVQALVLVSDLDVSGMGPRCLADGLVDRGVELLVADSTMIASWSPGLSRVHGLPFLRVR